MKMFFRYLRSHRIGILVFLLFCALYATSFALYRLPLRAILYPTILCGILGVLFFVADFWRTRRKHRQFCRLLRQTAEEIIALPAGGSVEEEDYQALVESLQSEIAGLKTASAAHYNEMTEYYTVWVHQIKTPIASMRLALESEDTVLSRKLRSGLFRIEQYVEMVLAFLRLDSPSSDYLFREHQVDDIVKGAVRKFAAEFIDRKLRLVYEPISETVITDEKWLSFVLEQILSNALKYTREGEIRISLCAPKILCIEDTGIGISPEDLPRIFEMGYTGCNGRRDKKASGLGLYLCKRICDNLGVRISAESIPDEGTSIFLDLSQYALRKE